MYEILVMAFGAIYSTCTAQYVKNIKAFQHREHYPRAYDSITLDDFVDGFTPFTGHLVLLTRFVFFLESISC